MLTWRQLKLHEKPVVFVDIDGYWRPFLRLVDHMVAQGFCRPENRGLFQVVETVEEVFGAIAAPQPIAARASDKSV